MNKLMTTLLLTAAVTTTAFAQEGSAKPVQVKLSEWTMGFMDMTVTGSTQFVVTNAGKYPHALSVEGTLGGKNFEISTGLLKAGESTTLTLNLPAGTYTVYCPLPGHEDRGMKANLTFK